MNTEWKMFHAALKNYTIHYLIQKYNEFWLHASSILKYLACYLINVTRKPWKIGIFTSPLSKSGLPPLNQLVAILKEIQGGTYLISGNDATSIYSKDSKIKFEMVNHVSGRNTGYKNFSDL